MLVLDARAARKNNKTEKQNKGNNQTYNGSPSGLPLHVSDLRSEFHFPFHLLIGLKPHNYSCQPLKPVRYDAFSHNEDEKGLVCV
jgi:hypothetical protein